jgi:hypothetical protein
LSFSPPSSPTHSPLSHPVIPTELPLLSKDGGDLTHSRDPRATTSCSLPWRSSPAFPTASPTTARPHLRAYAGVDLGAEPCAASSSGARLGSAAATRSSSQRRHRHLHRHVIGSNPALERGWPDLHGGRS